jgi:transcriptional regulator with GAF, ATPase, and Fis domain
MARKTERAEASFVETIVGRCGGLRSILSEVEVVAPTDATVLITGETVPAKGLSRERSTNSAHVEREI